MITLIYGSTAAHTFGKEELIEILNTAKQNNEALGITGILLYKSGNFLQVLEGEEDAVENIYAKIQQDPRHHAVQTILKRKIQQREFEDWKMGFVNLDELSEDDLPGYSDYLQQSIASEQFMDKPTYVRTFIQNFKNLMR